MQTPAHGPEAPDDPELEPESGEELDEDGYPVDPTPIADHIKNACDFACEYDCDDHPWPTAVFAVVRELERLQAKDAAARKEIERLRDHYRAASDKPGAEATFPAIAAALGAVLTVLGGSVSKVPG